MATRKYELASAYVRIMPSLDGVSAAIGKEMSKALKDGVQDAPIEATVKDKLSKAVGGVSFSGIGSQLFNGMRGAIAPLNSALFSTVKGAGSLFGDTLAVSSRAAGAAIATALGTVTAQVVGGGLNRALGINSATAGLKAMGFEGQQFTKIMTAAGNAVDGTAYSMDQSVLAARNFLAAGVPESKLQSYLQNVGRLADMGTRSYDDISTMLQSMAATGIIQGGDMLQLAQAGIPIFTALSKSLGVSVEDVKKLGSEGKITFDQLNDAVGDIDWDAAVYAATDVRSAFGNVRAQLSKVGANLWSPIIDKLPGILGDVRSFIQIFNKTFDFNPIQTRLSASMDKIGSIFDRFKDADGVFDPSKVKTYVNSVTGDIGGLANKLKGYEGIIVGAAIGMSGGLLAQIPIIGPVFAGLTPLVGAFAGTLVSAYQNSDKLRETVKDFLPFLGELGKKLSKSLNLNGQDLFGEIGDGLSVAIDWIEDLILDLADSLSKYMPEIRKVVGGIFKQIGESFKEAGENGLDGDAIATFFLEIVKIFGSFAPLAFQVLLQAATLAAQVTSSDWFKGLVDVIAGMMTYLSQNEEVIMAGLKIAAVLFVGSKAIAIFQGLKNFLGVFKTVAPAAEVGAEGAGAAAKGFKGLLGSIGEIALIAAAVVAAIALLGALFKYTELDEYINEFFDFTIELTGKFAKAIGNILDIVIPLVGKLLTVIADFAIQIIRGLIDSVFKPMAEFSVSLAQVISIINDSMSGLLDAAAGAIDASSGFIGAIGGLLDNLSINGEAAGKGAYAAAGGIGALMAAIAGGTAANSGTNFLDSALGFLTGDKDKSNPLDQLLQVVDSVVRLSAITETIPTVFSTALTQASDFGFQIPYAIATGIVTGSPAIALALSNSIASALSTQQAYLDSNPLIVRLKVDDSMLASVGSGSGKSGGQINHTKNTTQYISASSDAMIEKLMKDGRGF
jgi:tape measure domain-containing protein